MTPTPEQQRHQAETTIPSEASQGVTALQFTAVDDYTTFRADFSFVANDIVLQFFLPVETLEAKAGQTVVQAAADLYNRDARSRSGLKHWTALHPQEQAPWLQTVRDYWAKYLLEHDVPLKRYWTQVFPTSVHRVASGILLSGPPRLQLDFVSELSSWWFKAVGFVILKPDDLVRSILLRLDQDLEACGAGVMLAPNAM